jgi:hypothetical protein
MIYYPTQDWRPGWNVLLLGGFTQQIDTRRVGNRMDDRVQAE